MQIASKGMNDRLACSMGQLFAVIKPKIFSRRAWRQFSWLPSRRVAAGRDKGQWKLKQIVSEKYFATYTEIYSYQDGTNVRYCNFLQNWAVKCSTTVNPSTFWLRLEMSDYPSISRSEAIQAVNSFALKHQFTIDGKATSANDFNLKCSYPPSPSKTSN